MDFEIKHDEKNQKFYTLIEGKESYLQYIFINSNTLNMVKTYVPLELREQGIARKIVDEGLRYALKNHYTVIPSCSYVDNYIKRHPEFEKIKSDK